MYSFLLYYKLKTIHLVLKLKTNNIITSNRNKCNAVKECETFYVSLI